MLGVAAAITVSVALAGAGEALVAGDTDVEQTPPERRSASSVILDRVAEVEFAAERNRMASRITSRGEEREVMLPAPMELHDNDVLPVGQLRVDEEGVPGLRHEIVEVILRDGVVVDERVVATRVRPPTPTIVSVGTSTSSAAERNWEALARCESGGDPTIVSRSGRYHGLYQFDLRTWESVGGTGRPSEASPDEQRRRAILLYEQRGAQPWPTCGRRL